ncbi:DNA helicase PcrA [Staphylococcus epidermidis]|jgi:ATP-dependent DNA helicase pcrA|uniref:ATP-dependent DNA helicase PcrA n=14 Tax=Bacillales TaxID=1385 RepID=PCRA_STAEQ|nr:MULTISPECIES: DNA helicase PcrA [Staphylococcus]Q5HN29.1 RecName: Full=ATP-dependent DNA helicase PcrA; AltName: Full=DNA 3'-5' helicase PcrA [Staphylococcus epidermidis RP62A]EHR90699.1 ATP-dependent DNA helicase PcrA [Staphylococcus epidermidis VCU123]EID36263.1 ATP-dependent DNA helicase PcrA [Staphylococcus epidermidis IS-250]CVY42375.1 ATP-dependent DNA helicase PcrA [Streptococcus pneumoniae]AAW54831.1 ATP-dependent DNA helicase PcrA [Staphylococcus epidermidis RP62A]AIR81857.1 ATP-d
MNALVKNMNSEQSEAVRTTEGPLLIMAGAGSGKTRVLTHRIAYLLDEKDVSPYNILAITFTNKAAKEMKARVEHLVGEEAQVIWMSTFHSMCVRILRRDADRIGIERNFTIIDPTDQKSVIKDVLKSENIDSKRFEPRMFIGAISNLKNELKTPEDAQKEANDFHSQMVATVYKGYQRQLSRNEALDFDDLIMTTINLFERVPETLEYYQNKFQYIHVDEYQDTNKAQYTLVKLLANKFKNLCVVGDSDQSIYGWRGADIQNILSFEEDYPEAKTIFLEQNYRSTKNILNAANEVIKHNSERKPKGLWTANSGGDKIQYYEAMTERDEAEYVVKEIMKHQRSGKKYSEMAILYRTNAQSRVLEETFMKSNIPYTMVGGQKFYDRKEIKDLLSYLRVIANSNDDISLQRIINVPKRGIGPSSVEKIQTYALQNNISMFDALAEVDFIGLSKKVTQECISFYEMIQNLIKEQEFLEISEIVDEVLQKSGYRDMLDREQSIESRSRLENLDEFMSVPKDYEENTPLEEQSLINFLTDLSLVADIDEADTQNGVTLMTMHSAKGLEFPIVFIMGMEESLFPHIRAIKSEDDHEMEEERRICYVAITRAEELLYITNATTRMLFGRSQSNMPSRFLKEIPEDLLDSHTGQKRQTIYPKSQPKRGFSKRTTSTKKQVSSSDWKVGDKVMHKAWGEGMVSNVNEKNGSVELDIIFKSEGPKRLLAQFAPITKKEDS